MEKVDRYEMHACEFKNEDECQEEMEYDGSSYEDAFRNFSEEGYEDW